jgi:hypothetical protein
MAFDPVKKDLLKVSHGRKQPPQLLPYYVSPSTELSKAMKF